MTLIDKVKSLRNDVIANMSKVTKEHLPEQEEARRREIIYSAHDYKTVLSSKYHLGRQERNHIVPSRAINIQDVSAREISNGSDKYLVINDVFSHKKQGVSYDSSDRNISTFDVECVSRQVTVSKDGKKETLFLAHVKGQESYADASESKELAGKTVKLDYVKAKLNDTILNVSNKVDLTDINSVRYHLRNNKEAAHFLDKYVIVTSDEKKAYKNYAKQQDKEFALAKSKQDQLSAKVQE